MFCCLRLPRGAKVTPLNAQSKHYTDLQPIATPARDSIFATVVGVSATADVKHTQEIRPSPIDTAAARLDQLLHHLLSAAELVSSSTASSSTSHAHQSLHHCDHKSPKDLEQLNLRLMMACRIAGQSPGAAANTAAALSCCLLQYSRQQQQQWHTLPGISVPSADALINILSMTAFAQVSLDNIAVLQRRYKQYSQLLDTLGLDNSSLAACVQPASKALIACLLLGSKATTGEVKVQLLVQRHTCFRDAVEQLQQQGFIPSQQVSRAPQLAKLFPRFVDAQLLHTPQQPVISESRRLQPGISSSKYSSSTVASVPVEGGEGHGPRKEFFQLVGETLRRQGSEKDQQPALFVHLRAPNTWWFNTTLPHTGQLQAAYQAVGWLLAQSIVNRSTVGLQLAPLLFYRLLQAAGTSFQPTLAMLEQHDPETAQGLNSILLLSSQQFEELLHVEGKPHGLTKQQYVEQAVQQLLVADVAWQYEALHQGFFTASDRQVLLDCCFTGTSLAQAICGPATDPDADFDIRHVYKISLEDGEACSSNSSIGLLLQCLWQVVDNWSPKHKRALVKFVTGSDRLPPCGSERWIISFPFVAYGINQQCQLLGTLPQSHTCANTLELPNYVEALLAAQPEHAMQDEQEDSATATGGSSSGCSLLRKHCCDIIQDRLMVAITNCVGYGLDEATAASMQQQIAAPVNIKSGSSRDKTAVIPVQQATSAAHTVVPASAAAAASAVSLPLASQQQQAEHKGKQVQQCSDMLATPIAAATTHKVSSSELRQPRPQQQSSCQQQKELSTI